MAAAAGGLGGAAARAAGNGREARPAAALALAGRASGASGRRGRRRRRRERTQTAGWARWRDEMVSGGWFPGKFRLSCWVRISPGTLGARAAGPPSCGVGPRLTGASVPVLGRGAASGWPLSRAGAGGAGRGPESRPARLPLGTEPRALLAAPLLLPRASWAAPDAAPRLSLGCLPALCSRIPGRGKWVRKGTALPTPGGPPGPAQPVGTCPSPPEGEASSTRGLNHHFTPEPETGLTSRVSSVQVLGGFWRLVFHSYICVL